MPTVMLVWVSPLMSLTSRAIPKSVSRALWSPWLSTWVSMMLAGFTSRCSKPCVGVVES